MKKEDLNLRQFYIVSLMLFLLSIFFLSLVFLQTNSSFLNSESVKIILLFLAIVLLLFAALFFVWPIIISIEVTSFYKFPEAVKDISSYFTDMEVLRKEHFKNRTKLDGLFSEWQKKNEESIDKINNIVSTQTKDIVEVRQELANAQKVNRQWEKAAIEYIEYLENTLNLDGISEEHKKMINMCLKEFARMAMIMGLDIIVPEKGEKFDDNFHKFVGEEESTEFHSGEIIRSECFGFRNGQNIIKKAPVILAKIKE